MAILINLLVKCFVKWTYQLISEISIIKDKNGFFCAEVCSLQNNLFSPVESLCNKRH